MRIKILTGIYFFRQKVLEYDSAVPFLAVGICQAGTDGPDKHGYFVQPVVQMKAKPCGMLVIIGDEIRPAQTVDHQCRGKKFEQGVQTLRRSIAGGQLTSQHRRAIPAIPLSPSELKDSMRY